MHAGCQVVHFETTAARELKAWVVGVNSLLPGAVRVLWSHPVDPEFHARFSATARRYFYLLYERRVASAHLLGKATQVRETLAVEAMEAAASALLGEQDFTAFRAAACQSKTPFRCIHHARVRRHGSFVVLDIQANAFLQHMVRNIVGALLEVGKGWRAPTWIGEVLAGKERSRGGITAPPDGLYLVAVDYPSQFGLPPTCHTPGVLEFLR